MTYIISSSVVCGEINNSAHNTVSGWIRLRGLDRPLTLQLTGNCGDDLLGRCFRFEAANQLDANTDAEFDVHILSPRQVGPVGTMTAAGQIQLADCSPDPFLEHGEMCQPSVFEWKSCLVLEWFSQNGHVRIELLGAELLFFDQADLALEDEDDDSLGEDELDEDFDEDEDPYGLFPSDLGQRVADGLTVNRRPSEYDLADWDDDGLEFDEEPLQTLFDPPIKLYPAEMLNDHQVEATLQVLLARLARHGIALDMCEHFTPRQAYQLMLERILPEESVAVQLVDCGYVQHFSTYEFCAECLEEAEDEDTQCDAQADDEREGGDAG